MGRDFMRNIRLKKWDEYDFLNLPNDCYFVLLGHFTLKKNALGIKELEIIWKDIIAYQDANVLVSFVPAEGTISGIEAHRFRNSTTKFFTAKFTENSNVMIHDYKIHINRVIENSLNHVRVIIDSLELTANRICNFAKIHEDEGGYGDTAFRSHRSTPVGK